MSIFGDEKDASASAFRRRRTFVEKTLLRHENAGRVDTADELVGGNEDGVFVDERLVFGIPRQRIHVDGAMGRRRGVVENGETVVAMEQDGNGVNLECRRVCIGCV